MSNYPNCANCLHAGDLISKAKKDCKMWSVKTHVLDSCKEVVVLQDVIPFEFKPLELHYYLRSLRNSIHRMTKSEYQIFLIGHHRIYGAYKNHF